VFGEESGSGLLFYGAIGLLLLALHLWAIVQVVRSRSSPGMKALWIALLVLFPLLGVFNWFVMGPRAESST
jgi:hypothetical protein